MEEKYINKILNFADENICFAKELVINKEQAKKVIEELEEDYTPNAIIGLKIAELKEEYKIELEKNSTRAFILKCQITILEDLLEEKGE